MYATNVQSCSVYVQTISYLCCNVLSVEEISIVIVAIVPSVVQLAKVIVATYCPFSHGLSMIVVSL